MAPLRCCGSGRIRTFDTVSGMTVFKTVAFNHSATLPFFNHSQPKADQPWAGATFPSDAPRLAERSGIVKREATYAIMNRL